MQPCHVCSATEVDANGYCQRCRTYRGAQSYDIGPPASGVPYGYDPAGYAGQPSAPPYGGQASAPPYPGQASAPPYAGQPSGPPYAGSQPPPQPAYGYQAPPSTSTSTRSSFSVLLIALSVIAVILVAGIVGVMVMRSGDDGGGEGASGPGQAASSKIDKCVIGTWTVVSVSSKSVVDNRTVEFTSSGGTYVLRADGTGLYDLSNGVTYRGTYNGQQATIEITGKITFNYNTVDGAMTYSNIKGEGKRVFSLDGKVTSTEALDASSAPDRYTCTGNTLIQETELARTELRRS